MPHSLIYFGVRLFVDDRGQAHSVLHDCAFDYPSRWTETLRAQRWPTLPSWQVSSGAGWLQPSGHAAAWTCSRTQSPASSHTRMAGITTDNGALHVDPFPVVALGKRHPSPRGNCRRGSTMCGRKRRKQRKAVTEGGTPSGQRGSSRATATGMWNGSTTAPSTAGCSRVSGRL